MNQKVDVEAFDTRPVATKAAADRPFTRLLVRRVPLGALSVIVAAFTVYWATLILPGDAAMAVLGQQASPERLAQLRSELGLDVPPLEGFVTWAGGYLQGDFGTSLISRQPAWDVVSPRLMNSAVLMMVAALLSTLVGLVAGVLAANKHDRALDTVASIVALVASALPEFVVAVFVLFLFSVGVFQWFPAISSLPAGSYIWNEPDKLVLPVLTLIIVVTPYVFRMVRGATIEALDSDYCEVARLKGTATSRLLFRHALPNALAPTIQVVALNLLYLAGGLVMVESVFTYPGVGSLLVEAITSRDVPVVQFIVVLLAIFFVVVNISADLLVLLVTPRKRHRR